jgi:Transglycosylase SLT domain
MKLIEKFGHQPRAYAKTLLPHKEFSCLDKLIRLESHWNAKARNHSSGAFGIFQFMPQTWGNYGYVKTTNPIIQVQAGLRYLHKRYGNEYAPTGACVAYQFHLKHGWY